MKKKPSEIWDVPSKAWKDVVALEDTYRELKKRNIPGILSRRMK